MCVRVHVYSVSRDMCGRMCVGSEEGEWDVHVSGR